MFDKAAQIHCTNNKPFNMPTLVGAIDEGTSSARFILFEAGTSNVVCYHQIEIPQITPQEGWVEQDPMLILEVVERCIEITIEKLIKMNGDPKVDIIVDSMLNEKFEQKFLSFRILLPLA